MAGRKVLAFLVLGFVQLNLAARSSFRFLPTNISFPGDLTDEMRREALLNSLMLVKDDRTIVTTVRDPTFVPEKDVLMNLHTRKNSVESFVLKLNDAENLAISPFRSDRVTKIIIHGWTDSADTNWVKDMKKNFLAAGDYNVVSVDWSTGSTKAYFVAARLTQQVGEHLGEFLEYLAAQSNLSLSNVHIVGHSLGAHVAGYAGSWVLSKIGRITGLDPARPAFEVPILKGQKDRLDPSDASFVDVVHTCAGTAGFVRAIGHVDFYPNGGSFRQPGCSVLASQYCSHGRSHQFMTESIVGPKEFVAFQCESWTAFQAGKCDGNRAVSMGEYVNDDARGKYFLETNSETPFAKGMPSGDLLAP